MSIDDTTTTCVLIFLPLINCSSHSFVDRITSWLGCVVMHTLQCAYLDAANALSRETGCALLSATVLLAVAHVVGAFAATAASAV